MIIVFSLFSRDVTLIFKMLLSKPTYPYLKTLSGPEYQNQWKVTVPAGIAMFLTELL